MRLHPHLRVGVSSLVLESSRVGWGPQAWSWRASGWAGIHSPGPGEPQSGLGSTALVLESHRVCWGPQPWSWRATGSAGVPSPGPGEPQGLLGSPALVLESHRVGCGPQPWSWRATGSAGVPSPGPGEPQGLLGSPALVLEHLKVGWGPQPWSWSTWQVPSPGPGEPQGPQLLFSTRKSAAHSDPRKQASELISEGIVLHGCVPSKSAALQDQGCRSQHRSLRLVRKCLRVQKRAGLAKHVAERGLTSHDTEGNQVTFHPQ